MEIGNYWPAKWSFRGIICLSVMFSSFGVSNSVAALTVSEIKQNKGSHSVSGVITDATNQPIIGAIIRSKNSRVGTVTDAKGHYSLNVPENTVLIFSYIGYSTQEINVGDNKIISVVLKDDSKVLNDVVVIGYGKVKKEDLSAAVGTISDVSPILERPVANVEQMLQGQIPGVTVISNGGAPDSKPTIVIRGVGSPNSGGESPLYVVDGIPNAPFAMNDVTSITVLKDAASASIYGAYAGSAGVILITTKQASIGKTHVEYNSVVGVANASNLPQSLTIEQERQVRAKSLGGENYLPDGWDVNKNPYIGQTRTNWIGAIFRPGQFQRQNVAISGGTQEFSNRLSLEYDNVQGTLLDTYNKDLTARFNSMYKVEKHVRIRENLTFDNNSTRGADMASEHSGVINTAMQMPRNAEVYNVDGSFGGTAPSDAAYIQKYGSNFADIHGDLINPVRLLTSDFNENSHSNLTSTTFLDILEPIKGLNFTSRFTASLDNFFQKTAYFRRLEPGKPNDMNGITYNSSRATKWESENTLTYDRIFNKHSLGLMASSTSNSYRSRNFSASAENFQNESTDMMYFSQAGRYLTPSDNYATDNNVSVVGRIAYSYANRYFFTSSWRRDYAGRLPQGKKYGDFPGVTAAWKLTSEKWMPKTSWFNMLKLRASWGRIGNIASIGMMSGYPSLSSTGGNGSGQVGYDHPVLPGTANTNAFNPDLTWETSEQLDFGLDLGLFRNRLSITSDYFQKKTMGLIKAKNTNWTSSIGLNPMFVNDGEISNTGFEMAATWNDKIATINYWVSGNIATLSNKVTNIGSPNPDGSKPVWNQGINVGYDLQPYFTREGDPLYSYSLIPSKGVFKTQGEIDSYVNKDGTKIQPNAQVGDLKFVDTDGSGSIDDKDRINMGNSLPKLTYAFSGGLSWNNFSFSLMLQGVSGVKLFNATKYIYLNESYKNMNRSVEILQALNGPSDAVPRITTNDANRNFSTLSDYYLENGDYLRIKNLTIGYDFSKLLRKCAYFNDRKSSLSMSFSVDNLATFTKYSGIDPEVGGSGYDGGQYPVSRTMSLGVKMKF